MLQDMQLERPLVVFDIESTGIMPQRDRIVEIAVMKLFPDGKVQNTVRRLNPEMPIPPGATAIHGISDEDVKDAPTFSVIAEKLFNYLEDCDLCGYNITTFDVPMLETEFKRAGFEFRVENRKIVDVYNIFCKLYPRTLTAAVQHFCGKEHDGAHGAAADTAATWEVLLGQFAKHPELPRSICDLADFCDLLGADAVDRTRRYKWSDNEVVVNFGKNAGRSLRELATNEPGFLRWIVRSDFPDEVKNIANDALMGKFPVRKNADVSPQSEA